ncbi:MAG: dihydrodipicolinate synthase family protein [bacterium]|nr:dihydrodipicolinate synthase family protein [bacterium]
MHPLEGIVVPMLTPLTAGGRLDRKGLDRLTDRLLQAGVHGLFIAGTTGEYLALPAAVRIAAFRGVAGAARGKAAILAGIGAGCLEDTLRYAEAATAAGVDAVVLPPPPYFPMNEAELTACLDKIIGRIALPVVLYNIPSCAGKTLTIETVARLAGRHRNVIGLKDSGGDLVYFRGAMDRCRGPRFKISMGWEPLMAKALLMGGDGAVPGFGNLDPRVCLALYEAARRGDEAGAQAAQREIMALHERAHAEAGDSWLGRIRWLKSRLHREGVCQPHMAQLF